MEQKVKNIMRALTTHFGIECKQIADRRYEIYTPLSGHDHRSFLNFVPSEPFLRMELQHYFGNLNQQREVTYQELFQMLLENTGSFQETSAYLGLKVIENIPYVILQSCHYFSKRWEDRDIADIIRRQLSDMEKGLASWGFPDSIVIFSR